MRLMLTWTFNQTKVELKWTMNSKRTFSKLTFNQTKVELKYTNMLDIFFGEDTFNQTKVELKCLSVPCLKK